MIDHYNKPQSTPKKNVQIVSCEEMLIINYIKTTVVKLKLLL